MSVYLTIPRAVLVRLVKEDRARGPELGEKMAAYRALFASGVLPSVLGYANARILVIAAQAARWRRLAGLTVEAAWACRRSCSRVVQTLCGPVVGQVRLAG